MEITFLNPDSHLLNPLWVGPSSLFNKPSGGCWQSAEFQNYLVDAVVNHAKAGTVLGTQLTLSNRRLHP